MPRARLVLKDSPTTTYPIHEDDMVIGRSDECDIRLPDRFVSRRQARLRRTSAGYEIENLGGNPTLVNGNPLERKLLQDGDVITFGKTQLVFRPDTQPEGSPMDLSPEEEALEAMTVFLTVPKVEPHGPRFLITDPDGKTSVHPIEKDALLLGRSTESDVHLKHPTVSRRQAVVRFKEGAYIIRNVSGAATLNLNGKPITEERLFSGDELTMGAFRLTFLSDRPEDTRPVIQPSPPSPVPTRTPSWPAWLGLIVVVLAASAYIAYDRWYLPRKTEKTFELVLAEAEKADYPRARDILNRLLDGDLPGDVQDRIETMLAQRTLVEAKRLDASGETQEAKALLSAHVARHGAGTSTASRAVLDLLDELRFQGGQREEAAGRYLQALQEFSAIGIDSPLYTEAQRAVSRIWQSYQQQSAPQLPIAQLLEEAEVHFAAKRYTTPLGANAYALYRSVLAMDPTNQLALQRIDEMRTFYRETGNRYYQQKNCAAALSYWERYLVIDPQDPEIREKANLCTRGTVSRRPRPSGVTSNAPGPITPPRDPVSNLLEDQSPPAAPR